MEEIMAFSPDEVRDRSLKVKRELDAAERSKKAKAMLDSAAAAKKKTMAEDTEHLGTMVGLVANHDFAGATEIVHDLLNQRVVGALDEYKRTVAQNLFSPIPRELEESK